MKQAIEVIEVQSNYSIWRFYDRSVKAELCSTAVRLGSETVVIDPIPLARKARENLGKIAGVLITNANHARAAADFASEDLIFIPPELASELPPAQKLEDGMNVRGLHVIAIDGAAPGEVAFHDPRDDGTLIMGDAIINFGAHGFALLPVKYCVARKEMIRSLHRLLNWPFTRIFLAHGDPVLTGARDRFAALLECE